MKHELLSKNYTVLIIDDNPINLRIMVDFLEKAGLSIMVARDGQRGLAISQKHKPDIILLDVMMPNLNGFEVCTHLKANETTKSIPVIFLTALDDIESKMRGFEVGGVDYITKPVQQQEALARIKTHLKIQHLTDHLQEQNDQLQKLTKKLVRLNNNKDKFFNIVTGYLEGPSTPLLKQAQVLMQQAEILKQKDLQAIGRNIQQGVQSILGLLEDLSEWSAIEMGRLKFNPARLNLNQIIEQNIELVADIAYTKGIEIKNQLKSNLFVFADEVMLNTIIRNLLSNSLKFTRSEGEILITGQTNIPPAKTHPQPLTEDEAFSSPKKWIKIIIKDTGIGISPDHIKQLFDPDAYYTMPGTTGELGTGLGLMIVQEMVKRNGGKIWLESNVGQGTIVTFTLPLDDTLVADDFAMEVVETGVISSLSALIPPPLVELKQLHHLALLGDMVGLEALATHIRDLDDQYKPFADRLYYLTKRFEEGKILSLVHTFISGTTTHVLGKDNLE